MFPLSCPRLFAQMLKKIIGISNMRRFNEIQLEILEKPTIDCDDVDAVLDDIVAEELPPTLRARIDAHRVNCAECAERERAYREVIALAKNLPEGRLSGGARGRLRQALNRELGLHLSV